MQEMVGMASKQAHLELCVWVLVQRQEGSERGADLRPPVAVVQLADVRLTTTSQPASRDKSAAVFALVRA